MRLYENKKWSDDILEALILDKIGFSIPNKKLIYFPKIGHLVTSECDKVFVEFTRHGFSETLPSIGWDTKISLWLDYMYWMNLKNNAFCTILLKVWMSSTTYIYRIERTCKRLSNSVKISFFGLDGWVWPIEWYWKGIKLKKSYVDFPINLGGVTDFDVF